MAPALNERAMSAPMAQFSTAEAISVLNSGLALAAPPPSARPSQVRAGRLRNDAANTSGRQFHQPHVVTPRQIHATDVVKALVLPPPDAGSVAKT